MMTGAAGSCRAPSREPQHLLDSLPDSPTLDRLPGIEWVVVAIFVVAMTALWSIQRAEQPQRVVMPTLQTQVSNQNEYSEPDGFGPQASHGGDHEHSHTAP